MSTPSAIPQNIQELAGKEVEFNILQKSPNYPRVGVCLDFLRVGKFEVTGNAEHGTQRLLITRTHYGKIEVGEFYDERIEIPQQNFTMILPHPNPERAAFRYVGAA